MKDIPSRQGRWDIWTKKQDVRLPRKGESRKRDGSARKSVYIRSERERKRDEGSLDDERTGEGGRGGVEERAERDRGG